MPVPQSTTNTKSTTATDAAKAPPPKKQQQPSNNSTIKAKKGSPPMKPADSPAVEKEKEKKPHPPTKKVTRRSSKPFINWFQRKLAGTVRARRISESEGLHGSRVLTRSPSLHASEKHRRVSAPNPPPPKPLSTRIRSKTETKPVLKVSTAPSSPTRRTMSLDESISTDSRTDATVDSDHRSLARSSMWSPTSLHEADEDASLRPLPPSSPPSPSPSPSLSSSSYLSDPRTFRSMTASTKPTTLLSVDITGGMAHIAQAPPTPTTTGNQRVQHLRTHSSGPGSNGSITFSALPPHTTPNNPTRPPSGNSLNAALQSGQASYTLQAPQHTTHHPRNNPRPSSPPEDDASVLTLASSAFAFPGTRLGVAALAVSGRTSLADDSISHFSHAVGGDSTSHFLLGELDDERELEGERDLDRYYHDVDASVRALRPRSSRRGSWESEASKWSANASLALTGVTGMTSQSPISHTGPRSLWTTGSYRTGGFSVDHGASVSHDHDDDTDSDRTHPREDSESAEDTSQADHDEQDASVVSHAPSSSEGHPPVVARLSSNGSGSDEAKTPPATLPDQDSVSIETGPSVIEVQPSRSAMATPKGAPVPLREHEPMPTAAVEVHGQDDDVDPSLASDTHSVATTDYQTDAFHTPSTTPVPQ